MADGRDYSRKGSLMDTLSHALWGYASLRWRGPRSARWGLLSGAAPDLLYAGAAALHRLFTQGSEAFRINGAYDPAIWRRDGPPMPEELQYAYDHFYVYTHSLALLGIAGLGWYAVSRRPPWLLLPWALHIGMDIFSHERYQTPIFFPISRWTIEGYAWSRPPMLIANFTALALVYALLYRKFWSPNRPPRRGPWPEDLQPSGKPTIDAAPSPGSVA